MNPEHTDRHYETELKNLRERLLLMARRVEEIISHSIRSFVECDQALAKKTIPLDNQINRDEIEIDELCLIIMARWQPLATDLRFITLSLKMVTDLERIGDLAVNVCERVEKISSALPSDLSADISLMASQAQSMLHQSIEAFIHHNTDIAQAVIDADDAVDELYWKITRSLLSCLIIDESTLRMNVLIQSVAKVVERMADHSTNLAEQVIFFVRGTDVRHVGKLGKNKI